VETTGDEPLAAIEARLAGLPPGGTLVCAVPPALEGVLRARDDFEVLWRRPHELIVVLRRPGGDSAELRERLERAERVIADLQGSLSWRLTAPLRRAKRDLGRRRDRRVAPVDAAPFRVAIFHYAGKQGGLAWALHQARRHEPVEEGPADVFLIDLDRPCSAAARRSTGTRRWGPRSSCTRTASPWRPSTTACPSPTRIARRASVGRGTLKRKWIPPAQAHADALLWSMAVVARHVMLLPAAMPTAIA